MTDLDKARELAREVLQRELEDPCEYGDMSLLARNLLALDAQTRWISVEKELPEESGPVYACKGKSNIQVNFCKINRHFKDPQWGGVVEGITHWMHKAPLPRAAGGDKVKKRIKDMEPEVDVFRYDQKIWTPVSQQRPGFTRCRTVKTNDSQRTLKQIFWNLPFHKVVGHIGADGKYEEVMDE